MLLNKVMVFAQARMPVTTGKIIRKVTSAGTKKKTTIRPATTGLAAANQAARVKIHPKRDPQRTSGILLANKAAGVPGAK